MVSVHLHAGSRGGGWYHPQSTVHMVATRLGWKRVLVDTEWANPGLGYVNELRKCYSHLVGGSFLPEKAALVLNDWFANQEC